MWQQAIALLGVLPLLLLLLLALPLLLALHVQLKHSVGAL